MADTRTKNIFRNTFTAISFRVVSMLLPFFVKTIIIYKLGNEYLGLNSLFTSILQVLSLSELGFSTAVAYAMFKPVAEGDKDKICALSELLKKVYKIIGSLILLTGVVLMPFLPNLIKGSYPADINLYALYVIYLFNTVISYFMFSYTSSLLAAHQRTDIENVISLIVNLAMYIIQIVVLLIFKNYYIYIIFLPICTIFINLFRYIKVKKMYPEYVGGRGTTSATLSKDEKKSLFIDIGALAGNKVSGVIISSVSNIIISAFLGLEILSYYGNYYYIVSSLIALITVVYGSLNASIGNSLVTESVEKNYRDFKTLNFCNVWLVGWISICMLCLYQHFIELWLDADKLLDFSTVIMFVLYFYLWKFKDMVSTYKDAAGMWRADFLKPYVVTVVYLVLSLILVKPFGVNGVLFSGIVGFFVISMPWETHVLFKRYFKKGEFNFYLRLLIFTIIMAGLAVLTYFVCSFLPGTGVIWLIVKAMICAVLPNLIIIILSFRTPEFKQLTSKLISLIKRKTSKNK